jgi:penicillin-binding protein 2
MTERSSKASVVIALFVVVGVALLVKMAQLQLFSTKYRDQAQRTALSKKKIYPARGLIYDRNGDLLVVNNTIYDLEVIYNNLDPGMDTALFCDLLDIDIAEFEDKIERDWRSPRYSRSVAYTFMSRIKPDIYSKLQEHLFRFPGFYTVTRNIRGYPHQSAAHVLGYLGEVNQAVIDNSQGVYKPGDYIGVSGLERTYESMLRGSPGINYVLKDNIGREVGTFDEGSLDSAAISGVDITTALDLDLQQYGELLMQGKRGSIVAIEPATGEILSMISAPSYDPNILNLDRDRGQAFQDLLNDTINRPSIDRSVMAAYPPGSIFKSIFSMVALQSGITQADRTIYCTGEYEAGKKGYVQGCHAHPTPYNVEIAIEHSCNTYYYQLMREYLEQYGYNRPGMALDTLSSYLEDFGMGRKLGIDYIYESAGNIPTSDYYDDLYDYVVNGWKSTYVLSLGIGQGELQLTTLQMANLAAIIANRGWYITPHLAKAFSNGATLPSPYREPNHMRIDKAYYEPVVRGMERVMRTGTARDMYVDGLDICGKTGTSQNPHGRDHSVFFAFAPKDDPQIAIAVYVENAGFGADMAAPIASLMIEQYLNGSVDPRRQRLEDYLQQVDLLAYR